MSATNRGGLARHANDFYETPAWATDIILDALGITPEFRGYVVDPGSGSGSIAHRIALRAPNADVRGIERDAELAAKAKSSRASTIAFECHDWLTWQSDGAPDFVVGNPPYQETRFDPTKPNACKWCKKKPKAERVSCVPCEGTGFGLPGGIVVVDPDLAEKFIRKALAVAGKKGTVAMLLRANFMIPKTRRRLRLDFGLPDRFELEKRPSFNGSGTDATDYAWHVWSPKKSGKWTVLSAAAKDR